MRHAIVYDLVLSYLLLIQVPGMVRVGRRSSSGVGRPADPVDGGPGLQNLVRQPLRRRQDFCVVLRY